LPQFSPDTVTFKDQIGYGVWDDSHYREHLQFVQVLAGQTPAVLVPNNDFLRMLSAGAERKSVVETHAAAHALLDQITGVTETDYSSYNLDDELDFYNFTQYHSSGHQQLRAALGIS
jgi:hypothetical protein